MSHELAKRLLADVEKNGVFEPFAEYEPDGDCYECFFSDEPFKAVRLDKWVTVYHGRESNDIVGSMIKNVHQLTAEFPGLDIDIEGGQVLLSHMLRGPAYTNRDPVKRKVYKAVIKRLDESGLSAELQTA